jgi:glycosyltransferase involved in cell wall biosynthesis
MLSRKPFSDSEKWTVELNKLPEGVVCLLPHTVIVDEGRLDRYYEALCARKFVWVIQDLHGFHFPEIWRPQEIDLMRRRHQQLAKNAAAIIVHNDYTAEDVAAKLSVPRGLITVVRLPAIFEEREYQPAGSTDAEVLAKLGVSTPYALWASSSTYPHKNHEALLRAWRILADRDQAIMLICSGSKGPRWEQVSRCIRDLRLEGCVHFTGVVSDSDLATLTRNAKIAVCPTIFEGAGHGPASEAMIAGVPLAASNIAPLMEQFDRRTDLCTFFDASRPEEIAAAVEDILTHYEESTKRAQWGARQFQAMRSWEDGAQGYWEVIKSVYRGSPTK